MLWSMCIWMLDRGLPIWTPSRLSRSPFVLVNRNSFFFIYSFATPEIIMLPCTTSCTQIICYLHNVQVSFSSQLFMSFYILKSFEINFVKLILARNIGKCNKNWHCHNSMRAYFLGFLNHNIKNSDFLEDNKNLQ